MKLDTSTTIALAGIALPILLAACGDKNTANKDPEPPKQRNDSSVSQIQDESESDAEHGEIIPGPNGGRVLTSVEPHAEFLVTADRKVQITFLDEAMKPIPAADRTVSIVGGDRSNPTQLTFKKVEDVLISETALPEGNDFPVVVQLKMTPSSEIVREKFNLNLELCPTCQYMEYACICAHDHEEEEE